MALFVSFEGGEGSGKSTQVDRLAHTLSSMGVSTVLIHEPGSTNLGFQIRDILKGTAARRTSPRHQRTRDSISSGAELFLFAAARSELVTKVIAKEIKKPRQLIIADRYADSTVAYQSFGRGLDRGFVDSMNKFATQGLMPHKTFLLDLSPEEGLRRAGSDRRGLFEEEQGGRLDEEGTRRFEEEPQDFHELVRTGYITLAEEEPDRWVIVDATRDEDTVFESIWGHLQGLDEFRELLAPVEYTEEVPDDDPLQSSLFPVTNRNAS